MINEIEGKNVVAVPEVQSKLERVKNIVKGDMNLFKLFNHELGYMLGNIKDNPKQFVPSTPERIAIVEEIETKLTKFVKKYIETDNNLSVE